MSIQWSLVFFAGLSGAGGCLFAFIGLNELVHWSKKKTFIPSIVAFVLLAAGGLASVTHLSHPTRIMNALTHPTSGIFIEAALIGLTLLCVLVYLVCMKRNVIVGVKAFGVAGGVIGLALAFMAGHSYMMEADAAWNTWLLPLGYLTTCLVVGAGLWWVLCAPDEENGSKQGMLAAIVCAVLALVNVCAYAAVAGALTSGNAVALGCIACAVVSVAVALVGRAKPLPAVVWTLVAVAFIVAVLFRALMWTVGGGIFGFFG